MTMKTKGNLFFFFCPMTPKACTIELKQPAFPIKKENELKRQYDAKYIQDAAISKII